MTITWAARRQGTTRTLCVIATTAVAALAVEAAASGPVDTYQDAASGLVAALRWSVRPLHAISPMIVMCLVLVSVLHHAAAALAARAAAGVALPAGELVAAQFAASAANRLTPAGLGGSTLLGRYLHRRGGVLPAQATAAVSAMAVVGALSDVAAFAALLAIGALLGAPSMTREAPALLRTFARLVPLQAGSLRWALVAAAIGALAAGVLVHRRFPALSHRVATALRSFARQVAVTARSPVRLAVLVSASAATTLLLAAGFAATAVLVPSGLPTPDFGALMIGYMIAAAAGNAVPTPGGIGSADAALVGVLAATAMPAATAITVVLAFRAITFWAPAAIGLSLLPVLRRRGAL